MRAYEKALLVVGVAILVLAAGCGSPFAPSAGKEESDGYSVVVESVMAPSGARGLIDDATVTTVTVAAYDASHVQVGSGNLTKVAPNWRGNIVVSGLGLMDFVVTAFDAANNELWVGEQIGANITGVNDQVTILMRSAEAAVDLGTAGNYVILAKTGITTTGTTAIVGDIGISPGFRAAMTGFAETLDPGLQWATSAVLPGYKMYAADMGGATATALTTAVSDMETAYTYAAGLPGPYGTDLGTAGEIGGLTFVPGLYKWTTAVTIASDVTLLGGGGAKDIWIFQIASTLDMAASTSIILKGGALAKNIFWQVGTTVTLLAGANFEGIVLSGTAIPLAAGAVVNGRLLTQTAATMISNTVTQPAP